MHANTAPQCLARAAGQLRREKAQHHRTTHTSCKRSVLLRATPPTATATAATATAAPAVSPVDAAPEGFFLDETTLLSKSTFPIAPEELIAKCKLCLVKNFGCAQPDLLADSFQFVAPVVGPLKKIQFVEAFNSFDIMIAFPDMKFQYHDFRVDCLEPSRVWYTARAVGTNTGSFAGTLPATGKRVESPPQACSMCFDASGRCTQLTVGYVMDKQLGNTGGLGAVFGLLYAIGYPLPFPEAQPWQKSWQYAAFQSGSGVLQNLSKMFSPSPRQ
jgi:hypothetical protein